MGVEGEETMEKNILKSFGLLLVMLLSCAAFGATYTVDDDGGQDFTTIQDAIDAASAGDIVYVYPGSYYEQVVMKDEVNLLGYAPHVTTIDGQQAYDHVVEYDGTVGATIAGFRIKGSMPAGGGGTWHHSGIYVADGPLMIRNNIIEENHGGIAVKSGANPQIINNTIVNNINGIIFEGRQAMPAPGTSVLVIYDTDQGSALLYENIFEADGIATDIIHIDDVAGAVLSNYRLIVAQEDTGSGGSWGTQAAVDAIVNSRLPVLGIGRGGTSLFSQMGISINWGNSAFLSTDSMYVEDDTNPIFEQPHVITIPRDKILQVYDRAYSLNTLAVYSGYVDPETVLIGRAPQYQDYYPLASEEGHYVWGYRDTPDHLTQTGRDLLVNIVRDRITRCDYYMPNPVLVPLYSEPVGGGSNRYYFRVENWYNYRDEIFEVSPDLPPCGANPNASRTWVDFYDTQQQYLYGYCALGEAADLQLLSVVMTDPPSEVMMRIWDRRCDNEAWSNIVIPRDDPYYTHTIMNNIIVSNYVGIWYYNFINDGAILYNDVWGNSINNYFNNNGPGSFLPQPGTGQISADPLFEDTSDYRLTDVSPCKDAGNPDPVYLDPDDTRNDMGVWGGPDATGLGSHPGSGFVFTAVGNIPTSEIVQDGVNPSHGLAVVDSTTADDLSIPAYLDSPFGGSLRIYGLFGEDDIAAGVQWYKILYAKWPNDTTEPEPGDYQPITSGLYKIQTIPQWDGSVLTQKVQLGPKVVHGESDLYELTHEGWWSHIDLRVIWHTTNMLNGKYTLTYKAYRPHPVIPDALEEYAPLSNDLDHLTLILNNTGVEAEIHDVRYDPGSPNWDPATDGVVTGCGIITMQRDTENLRLRITARHPEGYLRYWVLDAIYGKNNYAGVIASDTYPGTIPPNNWEGVADQTFNTADAGSFADWVRCAYQFRLRAYTRATNGQGYLYGSAPIYYSREYNDHYFIDFSCSWCGGADINNSGSVDLTDLAILASQWINPCTADCGE